MSVKSHLLFVRTASFFAACSLFVLTASAQVTGWNGAADTNFFNDANWSATAPNTLTEYGIIDSTDVNQVAIIDAAAGNVSLDGVNLGETIGGGNVIQNGGVLSFDAFSTTKIGGDGPNPSSWIMNNDAVLLYDGPLDGGGAGYGEDGLQGADFDVGNGASVATFELHDSAILRIGDDMKISDNGTPAGATVLLDGNSQITAGSGTSVGTNGPGALTIAGNALYVSGNSAGPGNTAEGFTNEGYIAAHNATILVKESGRLWIRTLQQRGGETNLTIQDNARFDIFDVFFNAAPDLGVATVKGDVQGNERTSEVSENPGSKTTITVQNSGVMTVDSDVPGSLWTGLALSGGTNRGGNGGGGETLVEVRDQGSFTIQQDLNMTLGTDVDAKSTLKVRGPSATVAINGNLRMGLDEFGDPNPGQATLYAVLTGSTHSTIQVGGNVNIDNGNLVVELDGFVPHGGESFTLINAGSVTGTAFKSEDYALAPLLEGLTWEVELSGNSVLLNVLGSAGTPGDFDGNSVVDGADFLAWQRGFGGALGTSDFNDWQGGFGGTGAGASAAAVPEPTSAFLVLLGCFGLGARRRPHN